MGNVGKCVVFVMVERSALVVVKLCARFVRHYCDVSVPRQWLSPRNYVRKRGTHIMG